MYLYVFGLANLLKLLSCLLNVWDHNCDVPVVAVRGVVVCRVAVVIVILAELVVSLKLML